MYSPQIMGILNVTPDSFWEKSRAVSPAAIGNALRRLALEGADIIDIGAVSTRPGAGSVPFEEEWRRLEPALLLLDGNVRVSIDTTRSRIIADAYDLLAGRLGEQYAGSIIVNDISAGEDDTAMLETASRLNLTYVAMHKRGTPATMDALTDYRPDVVTAVMEYFRGFSHRAEAAGLADWILDPGFGFAKTKEQNLELLERLDAFAVFGKPVLAGIADKRFTDGRTEELHAVALAHGASILRVHDVAAARQTLRRSVSLNRL